MLNITMIICFVFLKIFVHLNKNLSKITNIAVCCTYKHYGALHLCRFSCLRGLQTLRGSATFDDF